MAQKTVGELIKEARAKAGLSQEKLAGMIDGLSASELSKAERNEKMLTQAELKAIAKICGVTQKSLLEAAGYVSASKTTKTTSGTGASSKSTASSTVKKTGSSSSTSQKTASSSGDSVKLTAAEKKFLELYRAADATTKKNAEAVLKGTKQVAPEADNLVGNLISGALDMLIGGK